MELLLMRKRFRLPRIMVKDTAISLNVITNFSLSGWFLLFWEFIVSVGK